jgi:hypothetical protein
MKHFRVDRVDEIENSLSKDARRVSRSRSLSGWLSARARTYARAAYLAHTCADISLEGFTESVGHGKRGACDRASADVQAVTSGWFTRSVGDATVIRAT